MGYSVQYQGTFYFTAALSEYRAERLSEILGEDVRDHNWEFPDDNHYFTYVDLEIESGHVGSDPESEVVPIGLTWDGSEKTGDMEGQINLILREMKKEFPSFGLSGSMDYQGEEVGDHGQVVIIGDKVTTIKTSDLTKTVRARVVCPECSHEFDPNK